MLFSRLFGKKSVEKSNNKRNHSTSSKVVHPAHRSASKKQSLASLSQPQRQQWLNEFNALTSPELRAEKIAQLSDFTLLSELYATLALSPAEKQSIENNLDALIHQLDTIDNNIAPSCLSLLNHGDSINLRRKIIRLYSSTEVLLDEAFEQNQQKVMAAIAAWDNNVALRQKAVKQISDADELRMIIKHGSDKSIAAIAKETLSLAKEAERDKQHAHHMMDEILTAMEKLANAEVDALTSGRVNALQKRWHEINAKYLNENHLAMMAQYSAQANEKIADFDAREQLAKEKEKVAISQQSLIKSLCKTMLSINAQNPEAVVNFHANCQTIERQWQALMDTKLADYKLADDYAIFNQAAKHLYECMHVVYEKELAAQSATEKEAESSDTSKANNYSGINQRLQRFKRVEKSLHKITDLMTKVAQKDYLSDLAERSFDFVEEHQALHHQVQKTHQQITKANQEKVRTIDNKIMALKSQIRQKNLLKSNKLTHYIENNIADLDEHFKKKMTEKLALVMDDLQELRGLHNFVTLPKKEQLCQEMEALANLSSDDITVEARQESIKKIQNHWRSIMSHDATADDVLWDRFHVASDKAYEPIKHHFQELDELRHNNLIQRQKIVETLTAYVKGVDWAKPDWKDIINTQKSTLTQWQQAFPIFYSENKAVQKQFDALMNDLRGHLDKEREANIAIKRGIVERAIALVQPLGYQSTLTIEPTNEPTSKPEEVKNADNAEPIENTTDNNDNNDISTAPAEIDERLLHSMIEKYQALQSQWKQVGIVFIGADRKLWKAFSAIGDFIFDTQRQFRQKEKQKSHHEINQIDKIVNQMRKLIEVDDNQLPLNKEPLQALKAEALDLLVDKDEKLKTALNAKIDNVMANYDKQVSGMGERKLAAQFHALRQLNALVSDAERQFQSGNVVDEASLSTIHAQQSELEDSHAPNVLQPRIDALNNNTCYQSELSDDAICQALNDIVMDLEVRLDLPSPNELKSARMAYQLKLLEQGTGQFVNKAQKLAYVREKEKAFYQCRAALSTSYQTRLNQVVDALK